MDDKSFLSTAEQNRKLLERVAELETLNQANEALASSRFFLLEQRDLRIQRLEAKAAEAEEQSAALRRSRHELQQEVDRLDAGLRKARMALAAAVDRDPAFQDEYDAVDVLLSRRGLTHDSA